MKEKSRRINHGREIIEEKLWWRKTEKISWRRDHGRGIMKEKP